VQANGEKIHAKDLQRLTLWIALVADKIAKPKQSNLKSAQLDASVTVVVVALFYLLLSHWSMSRLLLLQTKQVHSKKDQDVSGLTIAKRQSGEHDGAAYNMFQQAS
jgi:hypothetical protein